jgi:DNA-binding response OmpR family regulator
MKGAACRRLPGARDAENSRTYYILFIYCLKMLVSAPQSSDSGLVFSSGNLHFDILAQRVYLSEMGRRTPVETTPLEFRLLLLLAKNEQRVFSRDELLAAVWGAHISVLSRTVDSHISDLRRKMSGASHTINAVRGVGYQFLSRAR